MHFMTFNKQKHSLSSRFGLAAAVCAFFSVICFGTFSLIGSSVDAQGFLQEPFFLIPTGYFFLGLCLFMVLSSLLCALLSSRQN